MNCRKVNQILSAYMDGELQGVEHRQVFEHLARCPECESEYRQLLSVKRMLSGLKSREPHAHASERIFAHIALEEARRPSRWSRARLERYAAQIGDWWREQAGSPRTLAALGGAFAVALLLTRSNFSIRFGAAKPKGDPIHFDRVADEIVSLPVAAPRPLDAYTTQLRPLRPYRSAPMQIAYWPVAPAPAPVPWQPVSIPAARSATPYSPTSGDSVIFLRRMK